MAKNLTTYACENEEYIEMEITSSPSKILSSSSLSSSPNSKEFEFQMSFGSNDNETTTSSADELFFKGKLLPLHPSITTTADTATAAAAAAFTITKEAFEKDHKYSMPFFTCSTAPCTKTTNTPLDSCNISPSQSCRVSCELKPDDYFFEWSTELSSFINNHPTKKLHPSKNLKLIKHSILRQKLKASTAFIKSLFTKPVSSANSNAEVAEKLSKAEATFKIGKKNPLQLISYPRIAALMKNIDKEGIEDNNVQRKSFSGAIKRHSPTKCLSSSSSGASSSSSSFNSSETDFLRRSNSATEIEVSIDAAIAHCKKSLQIFHSKS